MCSAFALARARNFLCGLTQISGTRDTSNRLICTTNEWISFLCFFCDHVIWRGEKRGSGSNRIGRGILTHTIQTRCREQLVLLSYIASGKSIARAVIKKKDTRNQVFPRERNASPRHAYTRRATSNERFSSGGHRTPLLDIPIPFSFISSYFTSAIIPRLIRTVANACSTRIECESTRSDLFRLRIVRHPTTTLKSSNQRVDHVRASIEQREDRTRGIRPFIEYVYCIPYILENIFHDIV